MIAALHQPQYLPWLPYCAKANACDVFVYLDTVQYQKNGVQNRNQIKTPQGPIWLTVPVSASLDQAISEVRIADARWPRKHLQSIGQNYARAPFLPLFNDGLRPLLERPVDLLCELNIAVTEWLFEQLGVKARRVRASSLAATGAKDDLVIAVCKAVGATTYLSGHGAKVYQDESKFQAHGLALRYYDYRNPVYAQIHPAAGFTPDLSALDLVLNAGPGARAIMLGGESAVTHG